MSAATSPPSALLNSLPESDPAYQVHERGQDFAVFQKVTSVTNGLGALAFTTNEFTLLENGLHYLDAGEWKTSEDLIESFPAGAVARRGPNKTLFSPVLKAEAVFDMETSEGDRIRGGVRSIQFTDYKTGRSVVLASVKDGVRGEVVPPNQVVYRNGFDGLEADVLFVWKHNFFSQNVILRKRPMLPAEMDPATTRLEVVSELVESPEPVLNSRVIENPDGSKRRDDVTFRLGSLLTLHGKAFPVTAEKSLVLTGDHLADENAVNVGKEYFQLDDGRKFLIESVGWEEIQPMLKTLDTASVGNGAADSVRRLADSRSWPDRVAPLEKKEPMMLASVPYQSAGFLVDVSWVPLSGSTSSYTFLSGKTYYIAQSFYLAGTATTTFQPGCVIKYGNNAWLLLHCPFTFPPSGQLMPVLTSKDDDAFGVMISGSTHVPSEMADGALWLYFVVQQTTEIKNVRIRYAKKNIRLDAYNGAAPVHTIKDSVLQYGQDGIYGSMTDGTVILDNVKQCDVDQPVNCACFAVVGSMTADCSPFYTAANFAGIKQEGESGAERPDTMGAVGPNHFMVILNGTGTEKSVAVYDKHTGARVSPTSTTLSEFFHLMVNSGPYASPFPYPSGGAFDPRILYDHLHQRWIACALNGNLSHVMLAVSNGSDPVGSGGPNWVAQNWKKFLVPFGPEPPAESCLTDYDTLGVDGNGVYICVRVDQGGPSPQCDTPFMMLAAIPKSSLFVANPAAVQSIHSLTFPIPSSSTFPAVNFEPVTINDPVWFLSSVGGDTIYYNKLRWVNGSTVLPPVWEFSSWQPLTTPTGSFAEAGTVDAPQAGGTTVKVHPASGSAIMMAMTRKLNGAQYLWTCRQIAVNSAGNNDNPQTNPADRLGIEWFKIQTSPSVTILQGESGRIYDSGSANRKFYYMPSLAVNKVGDLLLGFSGSSENDYVSAYYWGRLNNGVTSLDPIRYFAGLSALDGGFDPTIHEFGDYSSTSIDPDGVRFWTVQEFAENQFSHSAQSAWGTRIGAASP